MRLIYANDVAKRAACYPTEIRKVVSNILRQTRTVKEAEIVVRCGECAHNLRPDKPNSVCGLDIPIFDVYGFCSEGVRREDDAT